MNSWNRRRCGATFEAVVFLVVFVIVFIILVCS